MLVGVGRSVGIFFGGRGKRGFSDFTANQICQLGGEDTLYIEDLIRDPNIPCIQITHVVPRNLPTSTEPHTQYIED